MAAVEVDICNLALGIIGDRRIQAMTERSPEATECGRFYDQARDEALEAFDWPFARSYARGLLPAGLETVAGFTATYAWPADAIAIRGIALDFNREASPDFTLSTVQDATGGMLRVIHASKAGGVIVYTRRETYVPLYPPSFVAAVAAKLAFYLAMPLTKSREKRADAEKLFDKTIELAAVSAGNQGLPSLRAERGPDWIEARG